MQVELVYEKTCPNIVAARTQLLRAFADAGITPRWQEWEVNSEEAPEHVHGYGSPTILVNGKDVSPATHHGDDMCCRVYAENEDGHKGVPAMADIVSALKANNIKASGTIRARLAGVTLGGAPLPTVGVALLPKLTCPACWPAYAGLLSSMGIGFINYSTYLMPLTIVFIVIVLSTLAFRARQRRGYRPLILGIIASVVLLLGKFGLDSNSVMYLGLGVLVVASLWNSWPRQEDRGCSACATPRQL